MSALHLYLPGKFLLILRLMNNTNRTRFTARGVVALVFSCISAFLGMGAIVWYGAKPLSSSEFESVKKVVLESGIEPPK